MSPLQRAARKKNLLLAFDAYGTLFTPKAPIAVQYGEIARRHGIEYPSDKHLSQAFKGAFKEEAHRNPNYGKASDMGAETWWGNVITKTFQPFLKQDQDFPKPLISDLLARFWSKEGYTMYPDVLPFFQMLRERKSQPNASHPWTWEKTVVGVITNSDGRVPDILESFGLRVGPRRVQNSTFRTGEASIDDDISFVVLSYDVGYEKPDKRVFEAATHMLKETLAGDSKEAESQSIDDFDMLYIGDEVEKDIFGASQAGWNAVLVDRDGFHTQRLPGEHSIGRVPVQTINNAEGHVVEKHIDVIKDLHALSSWPINTE